ncbi:hypothetical protein GH733_012716 [Mirounga leonina]|nr:hypothetical protein GH733_012716 [Mirounga leonina]
MESPLCSAPSSEDDVIVLNGTKEDVEALKRRMEERRLRAKLGKVTEPWGPPPPSLQVLPAASAVGPVANPRTALLLGVQWLRRFYSLEGPGLTVWGTAVLPSLTQLLHP